MASAHLEAMTVAVGIDAAGTGAIGTRAIGTGTIGKGAIGTRAIGTRAIGTGAIGPEIAGEAHSALAQGRVAGWAQGNVDGMVAGPGGDASASSSPSSSGVGNFRANWQAVLASLDGGIDGHGKSETESSTMDAAPGKTPAKGSSAVEDATSYPLSSSFSGQRAATSLAASERNNDLPGGASRPVRAFSPRGTPAAKTTTAAGVEATDDATNQSPATAQSAGAADGAHTANGHKHTQSQAASTKMAAARVPAVAGGQSPAIAAPGIAPVRASWGGAASAGEPEAPMHTLLAELTLTTSSGLTEDLSGRTAFTEGRVRTNAGAAQTLDNRATGQAQTAVGAGSGARTAAEGALTAGLAQSQSGGHEGLREPNLAGPEGLPKGSPVEGPAPQASPVHAQGGASPQTPAPGPGQPQAFYGDQAQVQAHAEGQAGAGAAASAGVEAAIRKARGDAPASIPVAASAAALQKTVLGSGALNGLTPAERLAQSPAAPDSSQHGEHTVQAQPGGAGTAAPAWAEVLGGAHGTVSAPGGGHAATLGAVPADSGVRATFAALDAAAGPGTQSWVHTGPHQAEAGFEDPALGWVGVRADLGAGGVHAALLPGSVEAAQALSGHLAGLNAYLAEHHTPVAALSMAAPGSQGMDARAGQGMNPGSGQNSGQGGSPAPYSNPQPPAAAISRAVFQETSAPSGQPDGAAPLAIRAGVHISVVA